MSYARSEDRELMQRVRLLPQELKEQIEEWVYELAFYPGFLYPMGAIRPEGVKQPHAPAKPQLLTVDKMVYAKYQKRFWAKNTVIIGAGPPCLTIKFIDDLPQRALDSIRKIDLKFSFRDIPRDILLQHCPKSSAFRISDEERANDALFADKGVLSNGVQYKTKDKLKKQINSYFRTPLNDKSRTDSFRVIRPMLRSIWYQKRNCLWKFPRAKCTLDFSECYGPDGLWMGFEVVDAGQQHWPRPECTNCGNWVPKKTTVIAPDEVKKQQLKAALRSCALLHHVI